MGAEGVFGLLAALDASVPNRHRHGVHPIPGSSNQIVGLGAGRAGLRTVPDIDGKKAGEQLFKKLTKHPPFGVKVTAKVNGTTPWWTTDPAARPLTPRGARSSRVRQGHGQ